MSDLRTGLVEATRRAIDDWPTTADGNLDVGAIVDVQLGFLTDNAEAWIRAGHEAGDLDDGMHRGDHALVDPLIAALRETG